jgi:hypothetical protein
MSFGFSVGDFIAVGKLISNITTSLQNIGGAKCDYRELVREFHLLQDLLHDVDRLQAVGTTSKAVDSIKASALSCRYLLDQVHKDITKYEKSLGVKSRARWVRTTSDKLRWSFGEHDNIKRLQVYISTHIAFINARLAQHGLERMDLSDKQAEDNAAQLQDQLSDTRGLLQNVKTSVCAQLLALRSVQSMLGRLYSLVNGEIRTSLQNLSEVANHVW